MTWQDEIEKWCRAHGTTKQEAVPPEPDPEDESSDLDDFDDDDEWECWCGAKGRYSEMHSQDDVRERCGGDGSYTCHCGGDLCVCHHHGEIECPGCPDCGDEEIYAL